MTASRDLLEEFYGSVRYDRVGDWRSVEPPDDDDANTTNSLPELSSHSHDAASTNPTGAVVRDANGRLLPVKPASTTNEAEQ